MDSKDRLGPEIGSGSNLCVKNNLEEEEQIPESNLRLKKNIYLCFFVEIEYEWG